MDNEDLRKPAVECIANYMHHELFEISKTADMLPWIREQASQIMGMVDKAIENTRIEGKKRGLL
jgi:hypothetical protein